MAWKYLVNNKTDNKILTWNHQPIREWVTEGPAYPTDGLIARYGFDGSLNDTYGTNNGFIPITTPKWTYETGKIGQAYYGYSTTDWDSGYITINSTDASVYTLPKNRDPFSISIWVDVRLQEPDTQVITFYNGNTSVCYFGFQDTIRWQEGSSNVKYNVNPTGEGWYHCVWTYDGTTGTLYVNNVSRGTLNRTSNLATPTRCGFTGQLNNYYWFLLFV